MGPRDVSRGRFALSGVAKRSVAAMAALLMFSAERPAWSRDPPDVDGFDAITDPRYVHVPPMLPRRTRSLAAIEPRFGLPRSGVAGVASTGATDAAAARRPERAREEAEADRRFVIGLGGAFDLDLTERSFQAGGSAFVELGVIENWLEIEAGVSVLRGRSGSGVEIPVDLLFKKPFRLRKGIELMIGVGPELVHAFGGRQRPGTFFGVEGALDFMFWPTKHVGLWVDPTYDLVFRDRVSLSFGTTAGPCLGW
jgi:hypothetical protein